MSAVAEVLGALRRVLDGQGLSWFVFGAQAVAVRGAPRATQDIDITVEVAPGPDWRPLRSAVPVETTESRCMHRTLFAPGKTHG
jgi:predicted nucleotidyltransferase